MYSSSRTTEWTTEAFAAKIRSGLWRDALNDNFLSWSLEDLAQEEDYFARITAHEFHRAKVLRCLCDPCSGVRNTSHIARHADDAFGILHVLEGKEVIKQGEHEILLSPGDTLLWDSTRPMRFSVLEKLHKLTIFIPQKQLLELLPQSHDFCGTPIRDFTPLGKIIGNNIRMLGDHCHELDSSEFFPVLQGVLGLISAALVGGNEARARQHRGLLQQIKDYVAANINNPLMNAASIARANNISKRYLYRLFEKEEISIGDLIRMQRLQICKEAITLHARGHTTLTDIALSHGFNDIAHFSKLFKSHYGISPRVFRDEIRGGHATPLTAVCREGV